MPRVVHLLGHPGGGAEAYIDLLEGLDGYRHARLLFSGTRSRSRGAAFVVARWPRIARRAGDADLVHAHGDTAAILAAPLLGRGPSLITSHGLHRLRRLSGARATLARHFFGLAVKAASKTVCTSRSERDELASILPAELHERLVLVPNGTLQPAPTDPGRRRRAREALGVGEGELLALYVGRLEPYKNPLAAIGAVELARARGTPMVLLIAGAGPLEPQVAARASGSVRPLGHRDDVEELYAAADVFVLPSRWEGMPMALLEAMARGLPPLVSDAPGNVEAVGEAGVIVPGADEVALSEELVRLAGNRDARARLGAAARNRVTRELSAARFLARMSEVYNDVAASGTAQGA